VFVRMRVWLNSFKRMTSFGTRPQNWLKRLLLAVPKEAEGFTFIWCWGSVQYVCITLVLSDFQSLHQWPPTSLSVISSQHSENPNLRLRSHITVLANTEPVLRQLSCPKTCLEEGRVLKLNALGANAFLQKNWHILARRQVCLRTCARHPRF